ncbi:MAG: hypothetical protein HQ517_04245 [SAR324 cluster bacterium]|nr:hypothetical protein [SAR324 cluster bacterium]
MSKLNGQSGCVPINEEFAKLSGTRRGKPIFEIDIEKYAPDPYRQNRPSITAEDILQ